jgi:hypothetical protein
VEVLVGLARVFQQDFLRAGAGGAQALLPGRLCRRLEERERPGEIGGPSPEMERAWAATNAAVPQRSAATAGDHEPRVLSQEEQEVSAAVLAESADEYQFTRCASGHERLHEITCPVV